MQLSAIVLDALQQAATAAGDDIDPHSQCSSEVGDTMTQPSRINYILTFLSSDTRKTMSNCQCVSTVHKSTSHSGGRRFAFHTDMVTSLLARRVVGAE